MFTATAFYRAIGITSAILATLALAWAVVCLLLGSFGSVVLMVVCAWTGYQTMENMIEMDAEERKQRSQ